jgi:hypothetical protein
MRAPLKLVLPIAMGLISTPLMLWDIHNQRVIALAGMAWDTGAPLWPYQTPDTLLFALNIPAFLISGLFAAPLHYFDFGLIGPLHYITFFPAIVVWWWSVGLYLDRPVTRHEDSKKHGLTLFLWLLALALIIIGTDQSRWAFQWWWTYSRSILSVSDLIFLRLIAPSIWCFVFCFAAIGAARRRKTTST